MGDRKYYIGLGGQFVDGPVEGMGNQSLFIHAFKEIFPEVIEEILDIYNKFEKLFDLLGKERNKFLYMYTTEDIEAVNMIKSQLERWAAKWFIKEEWIIRYFFETFRIWYENEQTKFNLLLNDPAVRKAYEVWNKVHPEGVIKLPAFNPVFQSENVFMKMATDIVLRHVIDTSKAFQDHGYKPAAEKRNNEHYIWFVHYHIEGWSFEKIADEYEKSKAATIGKEVNKIYNSIGINKENRNKGKKV